MGYKDKNKQKEFLKRWSRERSRAIRSILWAAKNCPCRDCGVRYPPYVMDFDHVRGEKLYNLSDMTKITDLNKIVEEIAKCDVVCSNCHRERTHQRELHRSGLV